MEWWVWIFERMESGIGFVLTNQAREVASSLDIESDSLVLLSILLLCLSPRQSNHLRSISYDILIGVLVVALSVRRNIDVDILSLRLGDD